MVKAADEPGREPLAGLVLRLVELHRQIDIADLERAARIRAEDPDLAHPRHVATLATRNAIEETLDTLSSFRARHSARLVLETAAVVRAAGAGTACLCCVAVAPWP